MQTRQDEPDGFVGISSPFFPELQLMLFPCPHGDIAFLFTLSQIPVTLFVSICCPFFPSPC